MCLALADVRRAELHVRVVAQQDADSRGQVRLELALDDGQVLWREFALCANARSHAYHERGRRLQSRNQTAQSSRVAKAHNVSNQPWASRHNVTGHEI